MKIKIITITLATIALACLGVACNSTAKTTDVVRHALLEAQNGNFNKATELCNSLMASGDTTDLTPTDYCRVAMVYALSADNDIDRDNNMALAARYLQTAANKNVDSLQSFINSLAPEQQAVLYSVQQLNGLKGSDFTNFEDPESITTDDTIHAHEHTLD